MPIEPSFVHMYTKCNWRSEKMSLLEFMRKSTDTGDIIPWVKTKYQAEVKKEAIRISKRLGGNLTMEKLEKACGPRKFSEFVQMHNTKDYRCFVADELRRNFEANGVMRWSGVWQVTSLEEFANDIRCNGEKIVGVETVYRLNDKYFGQWLAMHVPFRCLSEFEDQEVDAKIPRKFKHFAVALRRCSNDPNLPSDLQGFFISAFHGKQLEHRKHVGFSKY